jgi:hypothetical protein
MARRCDCSVRRRQRPVCLENLVCKLRRLVTLERLAGLHSPDECDSTVVKDTVWMFKNTQW